MRRRRTQRRGREWFGRGLVVWRRGFGDDCAGNDRTLRNFDVGSNGFDIRRVDLGDGGEQRGEHADLAVGLRVRLRAQLHLWVARRACLSVSLWGLPALYAYGERCGEAAAAYFGCRYSGCEDAGGGMDACDALLAPYVEECLTLAPEACDGYCDALVPCFGLPQTPESIDGCRFDCMTFHAFAARADTEACSSATQAQIECVSTTACQDMQFMECADLDSARREACDISDSV